jgi:hypothetical protein
MPTTTVGLCVDLAERKILDESNDEYSEQNLLDLYHLSIKEIINLVPSAHTDDLTWKLAPLTRQSIPSTGVNMVDIIQNMGSDGATPGTSIRETTLDVMKALLPGWEADTAADVVQHFMRLPEDKRNFMVYPKSTGDQHIRGMITTVPPAVVWDAGGLWKVAIIPIDDTYAHAIVNGMVYIAYDDDSDTPGNAPRSQMFYARFLQDLGIREQKKLNYTRG